MTAKLNGSVYEVRETGKVRKIKAKHYVDMNGYDTATSIEAYRSLEPNQLNDIYKKILAGLTTIGEGTFEEIGAVIKEDKSKVWKRMSELERMQLVYRPGNKRKLKSGRNGFTWQLTNPPKTESEVKHFATQIYIQPTPLMPQGQQQDLFS